MRRITELREICQSVHKGDFSAQIVRKVSIYLTWLLIPTKISGNGVSVLNCIVAVASGVAFYFDNVTCLLLGVGLFTLNTILDGVDGEVARYWQQSSLTGLFADRINTLFVYPAIFYGAGCGVASAWNVDWMVHVGAAGAWALVGLRLIKTSIDATLIDAITLPKARQEKSVAGVTVGDKYAPMSEFLRGKGKWHMTLIDFFMIRQPGMCLLWIACCVAEAWMRSEGAPSSSVIYSPLAWMLAGYAFVGTVSICYGIWMIITKRRVEVQFLSVFGNKGPSAKD